MLAIEGALALSAIGTDPLWRPDEARIALIAQQMAESGDWIVPRIGDEVYSRYPPLPFWLMALSGSALGFDPFALRLPGALAGLGVIAVAALIARRLAGDRAGLAAAIVLASLPALFDEQLTCRANLLLALASSFAFERFLAIAAGDSRRRCAAGLWVALAVAVLAKGPAGVAIPGVGIAAWLALERRPAVLWALRPAWGIPLFAALVVPWYALATARTGPEFLWMNLVLENFAAFATGFEHPRPVWFYLVRLPLVALPWIAFAPLLRRVRSVPGLPLAVLWFAGLLLLLSVSSNKRVSYLTWAFPAFAVAIGIGLHALLDAEPRALRRVLATLFGTAAVTGIAVGIAAVLPARIPSGLAPYAPFGALAAGSAALAGAAGLLLTRHGNVAFPIAGLGLASALGAALFHATWEPLSDDRARAGTAFCRQVEALVAPGEPVGIVEGILPEPGFHLYLRRPLVQRGGPGVYLVSQDQREELDRDGHRLEVLAASQVGRGSPTLLVRVLD